MITSAVQTARRLGLNRVPGLALAFRGLKNNAALRPVFERMPVYVDGMAFHMPTRFWHHYVDHDYEPVTTASFAEHLRPGMTFVDVGAHIGYYALLAARAVGTGGRVIVLEPSGANLRFLKRNIALNGAAHAAVFPVAAGDRTEQRVFNLAGSSDSNGFYAHPLTHTEQQVEVQVVRLDDLVKGPVDAVKIDVEGAELEVLDGMERILRENPTLTLWVEWNPACLVCAGRTEQDLPNRLEQLGFEVEVLDDHAGRVRQLEEVHAEVAAGVPPHWYVNLLARRTA